MEDAAGRVAGLLIRHRSALYAFLIAAVGRPQDAEDLFQEVSMTAIRLSGQYQDGTDFPAWVRAIARNHLLRAGRERGRGLLAVDPALLDRIESAQGPDPGPREQALRDCLALLRGTARTVLELRYRERLDVEAIAASVRKSVSATYAILKRARQALRECVRRRLGLPEMT